MTDVRRLATQFVEFLAAEQARPSAFLRLPLILLTAVLIIFGPIHHWLPAVFLTILAVYSAAALVWLVVVIRQKVSWWATAASVTVDVVVLIALCITSGGATSWLLPVFFVLPIWLIFPETPWLTVTLGLIGAVGYLAAWVIYSKREDAVGLPDTVYMQFALLLWLTAATTTVCLVLSRRSARVAALLQVRRRLVAEASRADDRHHRELAEQLHDGPLQTLLAARLDVEDVRERYPDPALDAVYAALQDVAMRLRNTVTALHPQVLAELGLAPAVRELVRQYEQRAADSGEVTFIVEIEEVGRPPAQSTLYRAARELLANVFKHARATRVSIRLSRSKTGNDELVTLYVADNGTGFDPAILTRAVADGHIGLASLVVGVEAEGGSFVLDTSISGTRTTITMPTSVS